MELSRIEIITGMSKFNGLKSALSKAGVRGMTVAQVLGCGIEKGTKEYEVEENYEMELLPKQQIAVVVEKSKVPAIVELIKQELYTGHIGDGKIFVYDIVYVLAMKEWMPCRVAEKYACIIFGFDRIVSRYIR